MIILKVVNTTNSLLIGYHVQGYPNYFTYISINSLVFLIQKLEFFSTVNWASAQMVSNTPEPILLTFNGSQAPACWVQSLQFLSASLLAQNVFSKTRKPW